VCAGSGVGSDGCESDDRQEEIADVEDEIRNIVRPYVDFRRICWVIERDAKAFAPLAAAYRMPKDTEEQRAEKDRVMEENLLAASLVPMEIMEKANEILEVVDQLEQKGSRMAVSDAGVAAQLRVRR